MFLVLKFSSRIHPLYFQVSLTKCLVELCGLSVYSHAERNQVFHNRTFGKTTSAVIPFVTLCLMSDMFTANTTRPPKDLVWHIGRLSLSPITTVTGVSSCYRGKIAIVKRDDVSSVWYSVDAGRDTTLISLSTRLSPPFFLALFFRKI